jgi:O-antigen/teichoic acid export membrane protein
VPVLSGYIARKEYQLLDKVFNSTMKQALFVMLTCLLMLFLVYNLVNYYNTNIIERFLPVLPFSILALASVALFVNNALATYLRCHKEEPYLVSSIVCGAINVILMFYTSSKYGITGMTASYFFVMIVGLIWGYFIFTNKKKKWHAKY